MTDGEQAGKVWCKMCERYLGAVSSTLKNHINTQEHKEGDLELKKRQATNEVHVSPINLETIDFSWLQNQADPTSGPTVPTVSTNTCNNLPIACNNMLP